MNPCGFDTLFTKNVPHILEKIFFSLDFKSYKTCLEVSNVWNKLLKTESYQEKAKSLFCVKISKDEGRLHKASKEGNKYEVGRLLSSGLLDVNVLKHTTFYQGSTPLHEAADAGHQDVVQLLLDRGADPNRANDKGWTALHEAAKKGNKHVVQLLLDRGADPNKADNYGWTVLHEAARNGHKGVVQLPLDMGADPNKANNTGCTALHEAAFWGKKDVVQLLLKRGADPNESNDNGDTALSLAQMAGHTDIVNMLTNP